MPSKVRWVVLCEDGCHRDFARWFLKGYGIDLTEVSIVYPEPGVGSAKQWVLQHVAAEIERTHRARRGLFVIVDGDLNTRDQELRSLHRRIAVDLTSLSRVAFVVPQRRIETWLRAISGEEYSEREGANVPLGQRLKSYRPAVVQLGDRCKKGLRPTGPKSLIRCCTEVERVLRDEPA